MKHILKFKLFTFALFINPALYSQQSMLGEKPMVTCADQTFVSTYQNQLGVCEGKTMLQATAKNGVVCNMSGILYWQAYIDLWGNGTTDLEFSSFLPSSDNDLGTDTNNNGIPDQYIGTTYDDDTLFIPQFVLDIDLSIHKVLWKVTDECGNVGQCNSMFQIRDNTPPSITTIKEKSVYLNNGQVEIKAIDLSITASDNCTSNNKLIYTFGGAMPVWTKLHQTHYFKGISQDASFTEYNEGVAQRWIPEKNSSIKIFDCEDACISPIYSKISIFDSFGNFSNSDSIMITIDDHQTACDGSILSGKITNCNSKNIANVLVKQVPSIGEINYKLSQGTFMFYGNCKPQYSISASKKDDYKNGVNTKDLLLIRNHILGITKLDTPEKLLAADVNNDGKISVNDMQEIRKLILGLSQKFSNNDSWIFIPKSYVFPNPKNPWDVPRTIEINSSNVHIFGYSDFKGIKIGDVDCSANP